MSLSSPPEIDFELVDSDEWDGSDTFSDPGRLYEDNFNWSENVSELDRLRAELEEVEHDLEEKKASRKALRSELLQRKDRLQDQLIYLGSVTNKIEQADTALGDKMIELNNIKLELDRESDELNDTKQETYFAQDELWNVSAQLREAKYDLQEIKRDTLFEQRETERAKREFWAIKEDLQTAQDDLQVATRDTELAKQEFWAIKEGLQTAQGDLDVVNRELGNVHSLVQAGKRELNAVHDKLRLGKSELLLAAFGVKKAPASKSVDSDGQRPLSNYGQDEKPVSVSEEPRRECELTPEKIQSHVESANASVKPKSALESQDSHDAHQKEISYEIMLIVANVVVLVAGSLHVFGLPYAARAMLVTVFVLLMMMGMSIELERIGT